MKYLLLVCALLLALPSFAQDGMAGNDSGFVIFHADSRIDLLLSKPERSRKYRPAKVRGYRVQIYSGNDRQKASAVKMEFMRMFPSNRAYVVYNKPQFRVRVGDFVSRGDASELYRRVSKRFTPCMIVPDVINVSSIKKKVDDE